MKFDLFGLGMLLVLQYMFELVVGWHGIYYDFDVIFKEEFCVYDMLCVVDSVGVF